MQNFFLKSFAAVLVGAACALGCASVPRPQGENSVGVVTYNQYELKAPSSNATDTVFSVITNRAAFDAMFTASGGSQGAVPDFSGQTVLVISMPVTATLQIAKAAVADNVLNVYANTCSRDSANCPQNGLALATVPKVGSVKQVKFFVNGLDKRTLALAY